MKRLSAMLVAVLSVAATPAAFAQHVLDNGRLHVVLADPSAGLSAINADRVDSIAWIDSSGASTGNLAANGGPQHCSDPQEYFGQSYGEGTSARPYLVISGDTATWQANAGSTLAGRSTVNPSVVCDNTFDGSTVTTYTLTRTAAAVNQLTVTRAFTFATPNLLGNLRAYVPRLPNAAYSTVLWPNAAGVVQTGNASGCPGVCEVTDWNGTWFADIDAAGAGLVVIRNPAKGRPAVLAFDNDSFSGSNNSSIVLVQPAGGWSAKVTEKQNLCFFDAVSWPAARRNAGKLPTGCTRP